MNLYVVKKVILFILIFSATTSCIKKQPLLFHDSTALKEFYNHYEDSKNNAKPFNSRINSIDKAYQLVEGLSIDSLSLKSLSYKASLLNKDNRPDEYYRTSQEYLNLALESKNSKATGNAYFKIGNYYFLGNKPDSAYYYFNQSRMVFSELNDSLSVGRRLLNMAIIQANESDYYGSEKTAVEALKYLNSSNKKQLISVYNCLAITTSALKNYDDALYWTNKCQAIQNNGLDYLILQNNKARHLIKKKEYLKAEKILTSLLSNNEIVNANQLIANVKSNLGYIYLKRNKRNKAITFLKESLTINKSNNNTYKIIESYRRLSEYFEKYYDFPNATKYADSAYFAASKTNNLFEKTATLKRKLTFTKVEEYKTLSQQYISWNDSLQNKNIANRDLFAKIKYDTERTRYDNLILNTKVTENTLKIAKETYRRNLGILISSLLVISVLFIIHYWRQRIKIAGFNATTRTENRISKKVHDEMANDISNIKTLVKNQIANDVPVKKQLINMLDIAYISARDIASETGDVIFSESFGNDLKNLLMQHNNDNIKIITNLNEINQLKIDKHKKVALYRTLQELMVNMNKHSKATRVVIAHRKEGKFNEIKYTDNGLGTDKIKKNNGLDNAASRMNDIKGSFSFETSKGNGFKALLKFKV